MTGDQADLVGRLKAVLPQRWFANTTTGLPSNTPVLDGVLNGLASAWASIVALLNYADLQSRIATATDVFLDMIAFDFFGGRFNRRAGEPDASFSARIRAEIIRPRGTRAAVSQVLTDLTGHAPIIFEPANATDTGGYGFIGMTVGTGLEYGGTGVAGAGGWGSLALPFQAFVTAYRATGGGIAIVAGYYTGSGWAGGGYGVGAIEWATLGMSQGQITDTDIDNAIVSVLPVATIAWTRITNAN